MGISPWYKTATATAPNWTIQLVPDSGVFNVSGLSTSNFSLLLHNLDTGADCPGQGSFSSITAAVTQTIGNQTTILSPASVQYQVAAADIPASVPARFRCTVLVTLESGVQPFLLEEIWEILPL